MDQTNQKRLWRKLLKKLQRKRRRQKMARQRDKELEKAEMEKRKDPLYESWVKQQAEIERQQLMAQEAERQLQEEQWLRRELLAQEQFKKDALKKQAEEALLEAERLRQWEELKKKEELRQKKNDELKIQAEKAAKEFDDTMLCMQDYLDDCTMKTPERLQRCIESRPGGMPCEFFDKTNCCGYGPACTFNHKRPLLSKIIIIRHFFQHPLLDQQEHEEYSRSDSELELSERDLRDAYDEFCEDVWPVVEEFGEIINFRTIRNVHAHLRGHVFVEYANKRSALKAFVSLQNRYYAAKRLNIEFSNIQQWRSGVCGMRFVLKGLSLGRKCPKGVKCNFFHLMRNKKNKYNKHIDNPDRGNRGSQGAIVVRKTPLICRNIADPFTTKSPQSRNWRWSESPEIELKITTAQSHLEDDSSKAKSNSKHNPKSCSSTSQRSKSSHRRSRSRSPNSKFHKRAKESTPRTPKSSHKEKSRSYSSHH